MTLKTLALSAILVSNLIGVIGTAHASNGTGYGGPDLSPTTVPNAAEQGLLDSDIARAYRACLVDGTGKSPSITSQFLSRLYGKPVKVVMSGEAMIQMSGPERGDDTIRAIYADIQCSPHNQAHAFKCTLTVAGRPYRVPDSDLVLILAREGNIPDVRLHTYVPALAFEYSRREEVVNEWGRVVSSGLRIFQPQLIQVPEPGVVRSERSSKIRFPYEEVVSCLQDQLQKAAR
jgi:hypothetical protein